VRRVPSSRATIRLAMPYILNFEHYGPQPGTILKVRSTRTPAIEHWGVAYWPNPLTGEPQMIHGMKGDFYRITPKSEFDNGQPCTAVWTPETPQRAAAIIARMELLLGQPWHLTRLNCEQGVMWALTGKATSKQLERGGVVAAIVVGIAIVSSL
jgi:hypothetical protein